MNTANPAALFRALIVYAICVPLAIVVGWMLTNPLQYQSIGVLGLVLVCLGFPLLMKWHYPILIFSWSFPISLFFLPGHPNLFMPMVVVSLSISIVERILNRDQPFLHAGGVRWSLLALAVLVSITAKLTGGFGLHSLGSDVYGGRKYVSLAIGILSFFAITARPIPKKHAKWYITLFFAGGIFSAIQDLYAVMPSPLHFIFVLFPPSTYGMDQMGNFNFELGVTRLGGVSTAASCILFLMLARHGVRENIFTHKLWRPFLLVLLFVLICLGGFRSAIIGPALAIAALFYLEKLHRTGVMLVVLLVGITGAVLLIPLASHLPYTFQRSLAFLPLEISPEARFDAESSTQWRLDMWTALWPQLPNFLLVGRGYGFSSTVYSESMGSGATFHNVIDAAQDPLALASDFHSGPLSLLIPFGIWAILIWVWFWVACFWVVRHNYRYGDADMQHINMFLYASFITKCVFFLFIFGDLPSDIAGFAGVVGLSIALNHGVKSRPHPAESTPTLRQGQRDAPPHPGSRPLSDREFPALLPSRNL